LGTKKSLISLASTITLDYETCPDGYYCPNSSTKKICPVGSACSWSSHSARLSSDGLLCPNEGTSNPSSAAMIISFVIIYTITIFLYKYISEIIVKKGETIIDKSTLLESSHQIQEDEGDQHKRALLFLSEKKAETVSFSLRTNYSI